MTEVKEKPVEEFIDKAKQKVSERLGDLWWWFFVRGLLALALGIFALFWPKLTVGLLVKGLGLFLLIDGVSGAIASVRSKGQNNSVLVSVIGILFGAFLLFWTGASMRLFLILVGAWALIQGLAIYFFAPEDDSDPEARKLVGYSGGFLIVVGILLFFWPMTGVVAVSWLLAIVALSVAALMIYVAFRLRKVTTKIKDAN